MRRREHHGTGLVSHAPRLPQTASALKPEIYCGLSLWLISFLNRASLRNGSHTGSIFKRGTEIAKRLKYSAKGQIYRFTEYLSHFGVPNVRRITRILSLNPIVDPTTRRR